MIYDENGIKIYIKEIVIVNREIFYSLSDYFKNDLFNGKLLENKILKLVLIDDNTILEIK